MRVAAPSRAATASGESSSASSSTSSVAASEPSAGGGAGGATSKSRAAVANSASCNLAMNGTRTKALPLYCLNSPMSFSNVPIDWRFSSIACAAAQMDVPSFSSMYASTPQRMGSYHLFSRSLHASCSFPPAKRASRHPWPRLAAMRSSGAIWRRYVRSMPFTPLSCKLWRLAVSYSERKLCCRRSSGNSFQSSQPISTGAGTMAVDGGTFAEGAAVSEGASFWGVEETVGARASVPPVINAPAGKEEGAAGVMEVRISPLGAEAAGSGGATEVEAGQMASARGANPAFGGGALQPEQTGSKKLL
eukprot:7391947-Prymnesium_polylepis.4